VSCYMRVMLLLYVEMCLQAGATCCVACYVSGCQGALDVPAVCQTL
jgi:hypothetical protein